MIKLVEYRTTVREVVGSNPGRTNTNNLLLTEREGRTGEYWPEVVTVRTKRSIVSMPASFSSCFSHRATVSLEIALWFMVANKQVLVVLSRICSPVQVFLETADQTEAWIFVI